MNPQQVLLSSVAAIVYEAGDILEEALKLGAAESDVAKVVAAVASLQERMQEVAGIAA